MLDCCELEHRARYQGRVGLHEKRVLRVAPVPDTGINLRRDRPQGVKGYEIEAQRAAARRRAAKVAHEDALKEIARRRAKAISDAECSANRKLRDIQNAVCAAMPDFTLVDLCSHRRLSELVKPRHVAIMLCKMLTLSSLPQIGRVFGNRDHTTILHAVRKLAAIEKVVRSRLAIDAPLSELVAEALKVYAEMPPVDYRATRYQRVKEAAE
jgi:hypothetical protein